MREVDIKEVYDGIIEHARTLAKADGYPADHVLYIERVDHHVEKLFALYMLECQLSSDADRAHTCRRHVYTRMRTHGGCRCR